MELKDDFASESISVLELHRQYLADKRNRYDCGDVSAPGVGRHSEIQPAAPHVHLHKDEERHQQTVGNTANSAVPNDAASIVSCDSVKAVFSSSVSEVIVRPVNNSQLAATEMRVVASPHEERRHGRLPSSGVMGASDTVSRLLAPSALALDSSPRQAHDISVLFGLPLLVSAPLVAAELAEASLRAAAAPARLLLDSDEGFTLEDAAAPAPDDSVACGSPLAGMFAPPSQLPPYQGDALRVIAFADVLCVRRSYVREECAALQPATLRLLGAHAEAAEGVGTGPEAAAPQFHLEVTLAGSHSELGELQRCGGSINGCGAGFGANMSVSLCDLRRRHSTTCEGSNSGSVPAPSDPPSSSDDSPSSSPPRAVFVLSVSHFAAAETLYAFIREGAAANVIHTFHLPHVVPLL